MFVYYIIIPEEMCHKKAETQLNDPIHKMRHDMKIFYIRILISHTFYFYGCHQGTYAHIKQI